MRLVRIGRGTALLSVGALALAVWACETARNIGGIQRDQTPPVITLTNTAGDTQDIAGGLRFNVSAVDNLALLSVNLTFSGGLIGTLDTTFLGQVKTYSVARQITFPAGSGAAQRLPRLPGSAAGHRPVHRYAQRRRRDGYLRRDRVRRGLGRPAWLHQHRHRDDPVGRQRRYAAARVTFGRGAGRGERHGDHPRHRPERDLVDRLPSRHQRPAAEVRYNQRGRR